MSADLSALRRSLEKDPLSNTMLSPWATECGACANMNHNFYSIKLNGPFNMSMALQFEAAVDYITKKSGCRNKLYIHITSYGGNAYALAQMMDTLSAARSSNSSLEVTTVAVGVAMSSGALLWCMGNLRYIQGDHTVLMFHRMQVSSPGGFGTQSQSADEQYAKAEQNQVLQSMVFDSVQDWLREGGVSLSSLINDNNSNEIYLYGKHIRTGDVSKSVVCSVEDEDHKATLISKFNEYFCNGRFCTGVQTHVQPSVTIDIRVSIDPIVSVTVLAPS